MNRPSRWFLAAAMITALSPAAASAAQRGGWDGVWSGAWGGSQQTAITIEGRRVVSYEYQGVANPVHRSSVTARRVVYGDNGVTVTMIRTGPTTASARLHSPQGDATAQLSKTR